MRNVVFALLAMVSPLVATDPPNVGAVVTTQMVDATTVVQFHERGVSIVQLDVDTMECLTSYVLASAPPTFTTSYKDTSGNEQTVTTTASSSTEIGIQNALKAHQRSLRLLQAAFPPMPPQ